jgi:hypothetical protein
MADENIKLYSPFSKEQTYTILQLLETLNKEVNTIGDMGLLNLELTEVK